MKHFYLFLIFGSALCAQEQTPPNGQEPQQGYECHHLSEQEKQFAAGLNPLHRAMFCRHFSVTQRKEAMNMVRTSQGKMTGDIAVEEVMKGTRAESDLEDQPGAQPQAPGQSDMQQQPLDQADQNQPDMQQPPDQADQDQSDPYWFKDDSEEDQSTESQPPTRYKEQEDSTCPRY